MSKKPETIFAEKVDRDLKKLFGRNIFIENIQQTTKSGTPDRLLCIRGHFVGLELKTDIGKPSKIQLLKLAQIKRAGGISIIASPCNWRAILEEIKTLTL